MHYNTHNTLILLTYVYYIITTPPTISLAHVL